MILISGVNGGGGLGRCGCVVVGKVVGGCSTTPSVIMSNSNNINNSTTSTIQQQQQQQDLSPSVVHMNPRSPFAPPNLISSYCF